MNDKNTDFQTMKQGYPNCRVAEVNAQPFRHGSLFSGIGGFDLAAEWMGWENVFHCEWNEFGKKVLNYYWPKAISYDDITKTDFSIHRGNIDILTGGFPCQPYSMAGKRLGKEDERHLFPEMIRAIREIAPRYIVGENVYGLVNWNGGMVFNEVQADLEAEGYEVAPVILPACAINAPHRRERIFFVAYANKRTADHPERVEKLKATGATTMMSRKNGENRPNSIIDAAMFYGLLPTPNTNPSNRKLNENGQSVSAKGMKYGRSIQQMFNAGLLPTPDAASGKTGYMGKNREGKQQNLETVIRNMDDSLNSQLLNPQFVGEMMGFPPNWTELPFLNGEMNLSKPMGTQ